MQSKKSVTYKSRNYSIGFNKHCRLHLFIYILDLSSSGGKQSSLQDNYHIAFGTKITGSGQHRKGSGKEVSHYL